MEENYNRRIKFQKLFRTKKRLEKEKRGIFKGERYSTRMKSFLFIREEDVCHLPPDEKWEINVSTKSGFFALMLSYDEGSRKMMLYKGTKTKCIKINQRIGLLSAWASGQDHTLIIINIDEIIKELQ